MKELLFVFAGGLAFLASALCQSEDPQPMERGLSDHAAVALAFRELSYKIDKQPQVEALRIKAENAQRSYSEAFELAAKKEDAELFEKYHALRKEEMERINLKRLNAAPATTLSRYNQLSDKERKQLYDLRKQAMNAPAVKDAREKRNAATTDEARKAAESEYRAALRKAMLETDEKLAPLLDKLDGKSNPSPSPASTPAASK